MFRLYFFEMKNLILFVATFFLLTNVSAFSVESDRSLLEKIFNRNSSTETTQEQTKSNDRDCRWGILNPPKCKGNDSRVKNPKKIKSYKKKEVRTSNAKNNNISVYTGTFDTIDKKVMNKQPCLVLSIKTQIYLEILF